jgi:hypothetical protein
MKRIVPCLIAVSALSGCASLFDAVNRDPVRVEKISRSQSDVLATVSLGADKRNVVVSLGGERTGIYCAEPPPEVAKSFDIARTNVFKGEGDLSPEEKAKIEAELKDTVKEAITVLGQRTVLLDVYRTGTYSLCQFYANGAVTKEQLIQEFSSLTKGVLEALKQPAPK